MAKDSNVRLCVSGEDLVLAEQLCSICQPIIADWNAKRECMTVSFLPKSILIVEEVYAVRRVTIGFPANGQWTLSISLTLFDRRVLTQEPLFKCEDPPRWEVQWVHIDWKEQYGSGSSYPYSVADWWALKVPGKPPFPVFPSNMIEGKVVVFTTPSSGNSFSLRVNPGTAQMEEEEATVHATFSFTDFHSYCWAQRKAAAKRGVLTAEGKFQQVLASEKLHSR